MNFKKTLYLILLLPGIALAQEEKDFVYKTEAVIDLEKADRPFEKVTKVPRVETEVTKQTYTPEVIEAPLPDLKSKIRIYPVGDEPIKPLDNNYVKVGFGNYSTPLLDAYLNSGRNDRYAYGLRYKHQSSGKGPVEGEKSAFSQNFLGLNGQWFTDGVDFNAGVNYERLGYRFYGYEQIEGIQPAFAEGNKLKQALNMFGLDIGLNNYKTDKTFQYGMNVGFTALSDAYEASETEVSLHLTPRYRVNDVKFITMETDMYWSTRKDSSKIKRNYYSFKPHLNHRAEKWRYIIGVNVVYENDFLTSNNKFHLYPKLFLQYELSENAQPYAGIQGDMQRNTLGSLLNDNLYLGSDQLLYNTNNTMQLFIGTEGTYKKKLYYNIRLQHDNYARFYTFIEDSTDQSRFRTIYDGGNVKQLTFSTDVCYTVQENFKIGLKASFFSYTMDTLAEAWHRPKFSSDLYFRYNLKGKIFISSDIYYISGIVAKDFSEDSNVTLDGAFDVNLKLDYLLSDKFSVFVEGRNLVNKQYQLYNNYPVRGINFLAGLTYSF